MSADKIPNTVEAWETDALGADDEFVRVSSVDLSTEIDEALCLQSISIRLEKRLVDSFKLLAKYHGVGYQPLMRDALNRFANAEMKNIVSGVVESQRIQRPAKKLRVKPIEPPLQERKRA
ncbi:hypothetical protein [Methylophilus sp. UBA6697]|jgi:hypothetical protein|uniref:hypothetical protein n=1 Tax=Methylophilus sp. UBA6697 TaxID=1946902 RepID=UPI000EE5A0CA|nr:hypothetical protein [Methylophilus sp. UBA6697]HCU84859.1 hypothetical protein [Methylophilus sp.]